MNVKKQTKLNKWSLLSAFLLFSFLLPAFASAQDTDLTGKSVTTLTISDPENQARQIPFVGEKVLLIQYTDPDVKDINDKLSEEVKAKKFDSKLYQGIGIANCKDTWIPNAGIRMKARQKEKQFPGSVIMLDENRILSTAWGLGDCNGCGVVILVGKDKTVKFAKKIKSEEESLKAIPEVLKLLEQEIMK